MLVFLIFLLLHLLVKHLGLEPKEHVCLLGFHATRSEEKRVVTFPIDCAEFTFVWNSWNTFFHCPFLGL